VPRKTIAARLLDRMRIPYELRAYDFDPEAPAGVHVACALGLPPEHVYKTLVLRGDRTGLLMACLAASAELDLKALAAVSGDRRVEMLPMAELQPLTGYVRGGVSPLGSRRRMPVYLDAPGASLPQVSVSAGQRGLQMLLSGPDLIRATSAAVAAIAR